MATPREPLAGFAARCLADLQAFSHLLVTWAPLRPYQLKAGQAVIASVLRELGQQFCLLFARQSGKDELIAQLLAYLLNLHSGVGGSMVVATPTYRPQGVILRRRLERVLDNPLNRGHWRRDGDTVSLGKAVCRFVSASPTAHNRGETASLLLVCNEAQEVPPERWDAVFAPMAASTNATFLFAGTAWSSRSLLSRQIRYLEGLQGGSERVFRVDWQEVARHVPQYRAHVEARIQQLGAGHPFIRTEYFLEELDAEAMLFPLERRKAMAGLHPRQEQPEAGATYALGVDVAGEEEGWSSDEAVRREQPRRDSTAVTVFQVALEDPMAGRPAYRVVDRHLWTGRPQVEVYGALRSLAQRWRPVCVVVDATGIGAGLASFLRSSLGSVVVPFVFTGVSKSHLGWTWLSIIDSGRYQEYLPDGAEDTQAFWAQVEACTYEVAPGPGRQLRWGVPNPQIHDDLLMSAALVAVLEGMDWRPRRARGLLKAEGPPQP